MRRLLIIFMLLTFPFQVSWAAVCAYCEQQCVIEEAGAGKAAADPQQADAPAKLSLASEVDCTCCHLCASVGMATLLAPPPLTKIHAALPERVSTDILSSIRPDRPERPKWWHAA